MVGLELGLAIDTRVRNRIKGSTEILGVKVELRFDIGLRSELGLKIVKIGFGL